LRGILKEGDFVVGNSHNVKKQKKMNMLASALRNPQYKKKKTCRSSGEPQVRRKNNTSISGNKKSHENTTVTPIPIINNLVYAMR
jgi:hypothetical protein